MEDLVVMGLAELEQPHWVHVCYQFGVNSEHGLYEDIDVCNERKCYKWCTNG